MLYEVITLEVEVELGFDPEQTAVEVERCLNCDIQTLNERATRGELEVTAISIHAYPYVQSQYALTNCSYNFV